MSADVRWLLKAGLLSGKFLKKNSAILVWHVKLKRVVANTSKEFGSKF